MLAVRLFLFISLLDLCELRGNTFDFLNINTYSFSFSQTTTS